jgi:hypothetical protein
MALVPESLERCGGGDRDGSGLLEREVGRLVYEVADAPRDELGVGAAASTEDLVPRSKLGDILSDSLDDPGDIDAPDRLLRPAEAQP